METPIITYREKYEKLVVKYNELFRKVRCYELKDGFLDDIKLINARLSNLGILNSYKDYYPYLKNYVLFISGIKRFPRMIIKKELDKNLRLLSRLLSMYDYFSNVDETMKKLGIPENFMTFNLIEILDDISTLGFKIEREKVIEILHNIYYLHDFQWQIPRFEDKEFNNNGESYISSVAINNPELLVCKRKIYEQTNLFKSYILKFYNTIVSDEEEKLKDKSPIEVSRDTVIKPDDQFMAQMEEIKRKHLVGAD
jgi:hypothetical protein